MKIKLLFVFCSIILACNTESKHPISDAYQSIAVRKQEQIALFVSRANRALSRNDTAEALKYFKLCLDVDTANDARLKEQINYSIQNLKK